MAYQASADDATSRKEKTQPTTVRLPGTLLEEAKELLASRVTGIATMSGLIAGALEAYIKMIRKEQIDRAFLRAAEDGQYQRLSREVNEMFAITDRETISLEKKQTVESRETVAASTRHA
jgi:hypothetical protein